MSRPLAGERYLKNRGGWYYYYRHVPTRLRAFYSGGTIRLALGTQSAEVARVRRDELVEADNDYWSQLKLSLELEAAGEPMDTSHAKKRYDIAKARALSAGFKFRPMDQLADPSQIEEIVRRMLSLDKSAASDGSLNPATIDAVLGGVEEPIVTISQAMEIYQTEIMRADLRGKSPAQLKLWKQTKNRSLRYFVDVMDDMDMNQISREDAQSYFKWWNDQVQPDDPDEKPKSPKTANKHFGDMRDLYGKYFAYMGDEDRPNPFRNLSFKTRKGRSKKRPPFSNDWVRNKILTTGAMDGLTPEIFLVVCILIETGCRHGEVINLRPEDIKLDASVPHIRVAERDDRVHKTDAGTIREIPLVGVALEAAKRAPNGFPKYHDKTNSFSAAASAAFTRRKLFETPDHVMYSFRHAFEDRMKEAGIDVELRMLLMGHDNSRPEYGTGGSMNYRRAEMLKIVHPFPKDFFAAFDVAHGAL